MPGLPVIIYTTPVQGEGAAASIAAAARAADVPEGALPNGSGLRFGKGPDNLRATSVIWEWVAPRTRAIVWPPAFATQPVRAIDL